MSGYGAQRSATGVGFYEVVHAFGVEGAEVRRAVRQRGSKRRRRAKHGEEATMTDDETTSDYSAGLPMIPLALHELAQAYALTIHLGYAPKSLEYRSTFHVGPEHNGIHLPSRTLYLLPDSLASSPCHWLHEVAHVVCCPPWEGSPKNSNEMALLFGWERACGLWLLRRQLWRPADYEQLLDEQQGYHVGVGWKLFRELTRAQQQILLNHTYEVGRAAGLLTGKPARPTLAPGHWTKEVEAMWGGWRKHPAFASLRDS